jgi:hypothetical protein
LTFFVALMTAASIAVAAPIGAERQPVPSAAVAHAWSSYVQALPSWLARGTPTAMWIGFDEAPVPRAGPERVAQRDP